MKNVTIKVAHLNQKDSLACGCSSSMCENSGDCGRFILAEDDELDDSIWETDIHLSVWSYGNVSMPFWFLDRNT